MFRHFLFLNQTIIIKLRKFDSDRENSMRKIIILLGLAALLLAGCYAGAAGKTEITVYEAPT